MTEHYLVVAPDPLYKSRIEELTEREIEEVDDYFVAGIVCSDSAACPGWKECPEDHTGYDPDDEDSPVYDEWEDVMIHGVLHTEYNTGYGWVVEYNGCPVQGADWEVPDDIPMDRPGKYLVDDDWEETECWLYLVKEII